MKAPDTSTMFFAVLCEGLLAGRKMMIALFLSYIDGPGLPRCLDEAGKALLIVHLALVFLSLTVAPPFATVSPTVLTVGRSWTGGRSH